MTVYNTVLDGRNSYYWSRTACATSYGDYTKAKIFHWLHMGTGGVMSGILESIKEQIRRPRRRAVERVAVPLV